MGKYSYNKTKKLFSQISQVKDKEELQEVYKALGEFRDSVKRKRDRFKYREDKAYISIIFYAVYFGIAMILNLPFAFYITGFAFGMLNGGRYLFNRINDYVEDNSMSRGFLKTVKKSSALRRRVNMSLRLRSQRTIS